MCFDPAVLADDDGSVWLYSGYSANEDLRRMLRRRGIKNVDGTGAQSVLTEVAAVELVGFGKTALLQPQASETVHVTVEKEQFEGKLVVYAEGIYQGYKYYETRYEDVVLGRYGASDPVGSTDGGAWTYADEVIYPFGYGLSYSTFTETLNGVTYDAESGTYTASVTVTNTSEVPGKHVVHLYAQTPYGDYERTNLVEKSAIQLAGFAKTGELAGGGSETLEITVDEYLLASYDYKELKGYYLSGGDYIFALGDDVHAALNNVLAAKAESGASVDAEAMTDIELVFFILIGTVLCVAAEIAICFMDTPEKRASRA